MRRTFILCLFASAVTLIPAPHVALAARSIEIEGVKFASKHSTGVTEFELHSVGSLAWLIFKGYFWRVSSDDIPDRTEDRRRWLFDQWRAMDTWLADQEAGCREA